MEGRTCGGRRQKTAMIEIGAFIRNVKERARMTRVEELAKNCIDWVWGCMGKEMQTKKMWSNQQKNYNDRGWGCMGKEIQGRVCGEIDEHL